MDIIHILPQAVSNQLSAEELIQRPSSVIKELMENALDAGAGCIDVYVSNAGLNSIQVLDNGKGMSSNDARLAFERHATSKINGMDDLTKLHTMGFRGVALSCIAAVSEVTMQTCTPDSEVGTRIQILNHSPPPNHDNGYKHLHKRCRKPPHTLLYWGYLGKRDYTCIQDLKVSAQKSAPYQLY